MSLILEFELGFLNAWIFMVWIIIFPIITNLIIKKKEVSKTLRTSVPMKYEKTLNVISMVAVYVGGVYSFFLPLKINSIFFYFGLLIFIIGFIIYISIIYNIRYAKVNEPFTKGPYKYSRHPLYLALFLILISISIMSFSIVILIVLIICGIHQFLVIPAEEQFCLKRFGKDYQEYLKRTPRWIGIPKK